MQCNEASDARMAGSDAARYPQAAQIQPTQALQTTQRTDTIHYSVQNQTHHRARRVRRPAGRCIASLERRPILLIEQPRDGKGRMLPGLLKMSLQPGRPEVYVVRIRGDETTSTCHCIQRRSISCLWHSLKELVLLLIGQIQFAGSAHRRLLT